MVACYDCQGKGVRIFLGKESDCKTCETTGYLKVCVQFVLAPDAVVVFRNQKCHNCGVKENDHNVAEIMT